MIELRNWGRKARASLGLWLPVVIWLGLIFTLSSVSIPGSAGRIFPYQDKLIHFLEFGVLGILLARAVYLSGSRSRSRYWACIIASALYGGFDELHQLFVSGRYVEWSDFTADCIGAVICTWAWLADKGERLILAPKTRTLNRET